MNLRKIILSSLMIALAIVLPFFTGQIPTIGKMLLPMHIPVLLCGLICGWKYGLIVGFVSPILRGVMFGMPPLMPVGISMAFELAVYGLVSALVFSALKKKYGYNLLSMYSSLILAMISGRIMWGLVRFVISQTYGTPFSLEIFVSGAIVTSVPGIILQLILIPSLMVILKREVQRLEESI